MSLLKQSVEKKAKPKPARRTARKRRAA
jgi:hypothetical protein